MSRKKNIEREGVAVVPAEADDLRPTPADLAPGQFDDGYALLRKGSLGPVLLLDGELLIDCNDAALALLNGSSKDQVIGSRVFKGFSGTHQDRTPSSQTAMEMIGKALQEGTDRFDWLQRDSDGGERWFEVSFTPVPINGKQLLLVAMRDISERRKREKLLQESEERHRVAVEHSNDAVIVIRGGDPSVRKPEVP